MRVESRGHGLVVEETLSREEEADELLLMGLRLTEGVDPARFAATAGRPLDPSRVADLCAQHLIEIDGSGRLRVTPAGVILRVPNERCDDAVRALHGALIEVPA